MEEGVGGEHLELKSLSFQDTAIPEEALLYWGWLNMHVLVGNGELIPCFACLCIEFSFLY